MARAGSQLPGHHDRVEGVAQAQGVELGSLDRGVAVGEQADRHAVGAQLGEQPLRLGEGIDARGVPVDLLIVGDLSRVQHGVAAAPHVDEGRLHAGQDVLHLA